MCGFYFITFIEYVIAGKTLLDYLVPMTIKKWQDKTYVLKKKDIAKENVSFDFRLQTKKNRWNKKLSFRRKKHHDLTSKKHRKVSRALNYLQNFIVFDSGVSGYVLNSAFAWLASFPVDIASSAVKLNIFPITAGIKKYKSIIKKKKEVCKYTAVSKN